jgi:hypothetical protein
MVEFLFFFLPVSIPAMGPTQVLYSKGTGALSSEGKSGWGVKLITHLHLVPRLRMRGAVPPYVFMALFLVKCRDNFIFTFNFY